ncbi:hypothetical protein ACFY00_24330 [Kitasatospora sp. NPDC001540]|uniref:hypothetical protein n=1 Tax=Kitasatospora sp. NPDC001540 TaxID=3364014 RepID=UPI0036CCD53D
MPTGALRGLTLKEAALTNHIAAGLTARDIARTSRAYSSTEVARKAIERLLRKTGASHRLQLTAWATAARTVPAPVRESKALACAPTIPPRMLEILQGWADGLSTAEIRHGLGAFQDSMDAYIRTLQVHLDVNSPEQAVVVAVLAGLVHVAPPGAPQPAAPGSTP